MREIKFRAWDKESRVMLDVNHLDWNGTGIRYALVFGNVPHFGSAYSKSTNMLRAYRLELMQYTGLKDKNSVEIYEGDILARRYNNREWLVAVKYDGCAFETRPDKNLDVPQRLDFWLADSGEHYVVGNIFESPELAEGLL